MKREHKKTYPYLYRHFPLLMWTTCCECERDFVREKGWMAITGPYHGVHGRRRYLCKTCAPSRAIAADYFLNHRWLKGRPPKPTAQLPRRDTALYAALRR